MKQPYEHNGEQEASISRKKFYEIDEMMEKVSSIIKMKHETLHDALLDLGRIAAFLGITQKNIEEFALFSQELEKVNRKQVRHLVELQDRNDKIRIEIHELANRMQTQMVLMTNIHDDLENGRKITKQQMLDLGVMVGKISKK